MTQTQTPNHIRKSIWLTRADLRSLSADDPDIFEWWLYFEGAKEYRAIAEADRSVFFRDFITQPAPGFGTERPILSRLMRAIWRMRPDLQQLFDLATPQGRREFVRWLVVEGAKESPALAEAARAVAQNCLSEPAADAIPSVQPPMTELMHMVWAERPDLHGLCDLRTADGQRRFVSWYFARGCVEMGLARYLTDRQKALLNAPMDQAPADGPVPLSRLMMFVREWRPDVQATFPLNKRSGRAGLAAWFLNIGIAEMGVEDAIDADYARFLLSPTGTDLNLPRILALLQEADPALAELFFGMSDVAARQWMQTEGRNCLPILKRLVPLAEPKPFIVGARPSELRDGVNLVGHVRGQFGVGEDVRMAALALQAAGIPFVIHDVETGPEVTQNDDSMVGFIRKDLPYAVTLLCVTGFETARLGAVRGTSLFDGRRTIGFWPWELPDWPNEWRHAYDLVDEVWASTHYTAQAYRKNSPKPVRRMPMTVTVDTTAGLGRRDFGLADDRFLFVFAFDSLSSFARKNPMACVEAFRRAFPTGREPAGLVVKAMRAADDDPHWRALLDHAGRDPRIHIVNRTLKRGELLDLYRNCDCFVSLHRAEGFGRGIAEAMILGKPVIVTAFSGNMDYTGLDTAALVDHVLRPVAAGEYPFSEGQLWADPDCGHAAWWMRRMVEDAPLRRRLAAQGQSFTAASYGPATVGALYAPCLQTTIAMGSGL